MQVTHRKTGTSGAVESTPTFSWVNCLWSKDELNSYWMGVDQAGVGWGRGGYFDYDSTITYFMWMPPAGWLADWLDGGLAEAG